MRYFLERDIEGVKRLVEAQSIDRSGAWRR